MKLNYMKSMSPQQGQHGNRIFPSKIWQILYLCIHKQSSMSKMSYLSSLDGQQSNKLNIANFIVTRLELEKQTLGLGRVENL